MIDYIFSNIEERDTDFAIIRSFVNNDKVRELFFSLIKERGELVKVYHSLTQVESDGHDGESDIILICENFSGKFAIFIEDKIAADPQPSQRERYEDRAKLLKEKEGYTNYYVVLCAPQEYLDSEKAKKYELKISHEDINSCLEKNDFDKNVFDFSTLEKKQGYAVIKNDVVTDFWSNLYEYIEKHYPFLRVNKNEKARGSAAEWVTYVTGVKGLNVIWKANKGYIDLEFAGMADNPKIVGKFLNKIGCSNEDLFKTGKSLSARRYIPSDKKVSFHESFSPQLKEIDYNLTVISELYEIAKKIKYIDNSGFPIITI